MLSVPTDLDYAKNEDTVPADIIVFYAGTSGTPLSIKEAK